MVKTFESIDDYLETVDTGKAFFVYFYFDGKDFSTDIHPRYELIAQESLEDEEVNIEFYEIDLATQEDVAREAGVGPSKVPTFHFYRDGDKEEELYGGVFSALDLLYHKVTGKLPSTSKDIPLGSPLNASEDESDF